MGEALVEVGSSIGFLCLGTQQSLLVGLSSHCNLYLELADKSEVVVDEVANALQHIRLGAVLPIVYLLMLDLIVAVEQVQLVESNLRMFSYGHVDVYYQRQHVCQQMQLQPSYGLPAVLSVKPFQQ